MFEADAGAVFHHASPVDATALIVSSTRTATRIRLLSKSRRQLSCVPMRTIHELERFLLAHRELAQSIALSLARVSPIAGDALILGGVQRRYLPKRPGDDPFQMQHR